MSPAPVSKLFDEAEIAARVKALAGEIVRAMGAEFVVIGVLKGSFVFIADLARALARAGAPPKVEFMRLASYGQKKKVPARSCCSPTCRAISSAGPVILVDDIVDTGLSMAYGKRLLTERHASQVLPARCWTSPAGVRSRSRSTSSASRFRTCSWSATASTTPSSTATCRISARCLSVAQAARPVAAWSRRRIIASVRPVDEAAMGGGRGSVGDD